MVQLLIRIKAEYGSLYFHYTDDFNMHPLEAHISIFYISNITSNFLFDIFIVYKFFKVLVSKAFCLIFISSYCTMYVTAVAIQVLIQSRYFFMIIIIIIAILIFSANHIEFSQDKLKFTTQMILSHVLGIAA